MKSLWILAAGAMALFAQPQCRILLAPSPDFGFLIGSGSPDGTYRWMRNGQLLRPAHSTELFLLHADDSLAAADGRQPLQADRIGYEAGRWGLAAIVEGTLAYSAEGSVDFREGTIEMWAALRFDAADPIYSDRDHTLFQYRAPNGDRISIAQSRSSGILYAGGTVAGQWQSAYGGRASMRLWQPGEWHHLAYTFSAVENRMRFYVDGVLTADTNEKRYQPPAPGGDRFFLGSPYYRVDEVRISGRAMDAAEVRANARRLDQPRHYEVWLPLADVAAGDSIVLESGGCASRAFVYRGIPLSEVNPPSTLLPPETTSLLFSVRSLDPTSCSYSVGTLRDYAAMQPFEAGQGTTRHQTTFTGLSGHAATVENVYVRCASDPEYVLALQYRSLPRVNPSFPRKGNLWGSWNMIPKGLQYASRIDLYLGANFTPAEIRALRALNPNILVLTSINTVENFGLPDDYYLKDIHGNRIEVWPGTYRLNLTKRYVAEYQARYAYEQILDSGLMVDGCFFDNFFTTQSWLRADIHGNRVQLDADEDGVEDDPKVLDAAWREGVYHELETWRTLMPHALASGHLPRPPQPEFASIFNGDSIGFLTADVLEGKRPFQDLWNAYHGWWEIGRQPAITMIESSPQDQIAYGYDYDPLRKIPPSTLEFARTYYPNVRFGLAFTLMNDGYFAHEFGDTWHGNDWWYDELDFDLGYPLGPAQRVDLGEIPAANLLDNGDFEEPLEGTWRLTINTAAGAAATVVRDTSSAAVGSASARIRITSAGQGTDWHVDFNQRDRKLVRGVTYDLSFWARSDVARTIALSSQKGSPDWRNYGLSRQVAITTDWKRYVVSFQAKETVDDARIQFFVGARTGDVWLDDVRLAERPPEVYRRDFTNGTVLLNGTRERRTITLGPGFNRLSGDQAARYQYILDDGDPEFSATGNWKLVTYDSGEWKSTGPFYHDWGPSCRQLDGNEGSAEWDLALRADDVYTIEAWWPAAPSASSWSRKVVYEVVAEGRVLAATTVDQSTGGDQWHVIAQLPLSAAASPRVRIRNEGSGPAIADALHVRSAARYNDGSPAPSVTLEPMDGIVLSREFR